MLMEGKDRSAASTNGRSRRGNPGNADRLFDALPGAHVPTIQGFREITLAETGRRAF
jgi:hypothetical protein